MIVDSSAIVAILKGEPEAGAFALAIGAAPEATICAASYFEASIFIDGARDEAVSAKFDRVLEELAITVEPFTARQAYIARRAYRQYGKGSGHKAQLNFGDCFAYALAIDTNRPLLYKGDDFGHTDVAPAR